MADSKSTPPATLTQYVLQTLRDWILSGRIPVGARLDQQKIAAELGVSAIPMREGLRQLEAEGLVRIYPYRGAFVTELSFSELEDVYLVREVLEELATQLAVPNLTDATFAELADLLSRMKTATDQQDFERLLDLNRTFHFTIYQASNRPILVQIIASLWDRSGAYRRLYTYLPQRAGRALAEHQSIFAACKAGDAASAGRAVRENVRQTTDVIRGKLRGKDADASSAIEHPG
jgi:DNA-binding GntR family transcriptional regulator